jgi:hypothetical protein
VATFAETSDLICFCRIAAVCRQRSKEANLTAMTCLVD